MFRFPRSKICRPLLLGLVLLCAVTVNYGQASAQQYPPGFTPLVPNSPQGNSFGMQGKISAPPPTVGARITAPSTGQSYSTIPITVSGICPDNLLVEILDNGVLVGSTMCEHGSFSVQTALFPGDNELTATVRDDLGQEGPPSNVVTVTYNTVTSTEFSAFAASITLTSSYSRRSADPGVALIWPVQLSGGTGPYAFSIDWGDGTAPELMSQSSAGIISLKHTYKSAGIYRVTIKVVDTNGVSGFLQVIAVANGKAEAAIKSGDKEPAVTVIRNRIIWLPAAVVLALLIPAFWLGRRAEARAIRKHLEEQQEMVRKLDT
jgi:hypothetical protein